MMRAHRGFSLIEMALVLMVVTLLLGGLLVPFATQVEQRRIAETQKSLAEVQEALLGFAIANGRLPCPDTLNNTPTSNDGLEDVCAGLESEGNLPWATLGVGATDAWGNRLRYRVTNAFTLNFNLATLGTLRVCDTAACATSAATNVPAVILSHGKNGYGAINANTGAGAPVFNIAPTSPDEAENNDMADGNFVSRTVTAPNSGAGEFDDLVIWLSPNVLFNRMVAAGRLP